MPVSVVDASAIAAVIFNEDKRFETEDQLAGYSLVAPMLITYELSSICLKKCRVWPQYRDEFIEGLRKGLSLPIELLRIDHEAAFRLAETQALSAYHASYLWLSVTTSTPLVTLDQELKRAAQRLGVA